MADRLVQAETSAPPALYSWWFTASVWGHVWEQCSVCPAVTSRDCNDTQGTNVPNVHLGTFLLNMALEKMALKTGEKTVLVFTPLVCPLSGCRQSALEAEAAGR